MYQIDVGVRTVSPTVHVFERAYYTSITTPLALVWDWLIHYDMNMRLLSQDWLTTHSLFWYASVHTRVQTSNNLKSIRTRVHYKNKSERMNKYTYNHILISNAHKEILTSYCTSGSRYITVFICSFAYRWLVPTRRYLVPVQSTVVGLVVGLQIISSTYNS